MAPGYKLLVSLGKELVSPWISGYVYHRFNENKRRPGWGPLALYESPDGAAVLMIQVIQFWRPNCQAFIFECSFEPSNDTKLWRLDDEGKKYQNDFPLPPGTVLADSITLGRIHQIWQLVGNWKMDELGPEHDYFRP